MILPFFWRFLAFLGRFSAYAVKKITLKNYLNWASSVEGFVGRSWLKLWADLANYYPLNLNFSERL